MGQSYEIWYKNAKELQTNLSFHMGNRIWDVFLLPNENEYLFQKIAVALYWLPNYGPVNDLGLTQSQKEMTDVIKTKLRSIAEQSGNCGKYCYADFAMPGSYIYTISIGIAYINVFHDENSQYLVPLFRVKVVDNYDISDVCKNTYVDHDGKSYKDWTTYIQEAWRGCIRYCPLYGCYATGKKRLFKPLNLSTEAVPSSTQRTLDVMKQGCDLISKTCKIAGSGIEYFFPTFTGLPLLRSFTFGLRLTNHSIGMFENSVRLADMKSYGENPLNEDASVVWMSLVRNSFNLRSFGIDESSLHVLQTPEGFSLKIASLYFWCKYTKDHFNNLTDLETFKFKMASLLFSHSLIPVINDILNRGEHADIVPVLSINGI